MNKEMLVGIGIFVALYILYKIFSKKPDAALDKEISEILSKDKYRVKGQFEE